MNFNEAVRNLQMTPPPVPVLFDTKQSFHSHSTTISDEELHIALKSNKSKANRNKIKANQTPTAQVFKNYEENEVIASNSDTYDDDIDTEIDTETEDYLSSNDDTQNNNTKEKPQRGIKLFESKTVHNIPAKLPKAKSARVRTHSDASSNMTLLCLPNHINESDDEIYEETLDNNNINNLSLPGIGGASGSNKMHMRSYSESNIQKNAQKNQWPSSPSSDDSFDEINSARSQGSSAHRNNLYSKFVIMKKKYRKQRRISRQFQDAITAIQDNNEDSLVTTEEQIRDQFEKEYEIKLIELEHEKLNTAITIEDKMKHILSKNDELMLQNKLLQQQVVAQVAMIQEQQQMTFAFEQQRHFVRMHSGDSMVSMVSIPHINSPSTPVSNIHQFTSQPHPSQAILRRVSSASTINTPMLPHGTINAATNKNLSLNRACLGLTPQTSNNTNNTTTATFEEANYTLNDELNSMNSYQTDNSMINIGDMNNKNNMVNMEPNHHKYVVKSNRNNHSKSTKKKKKLKLIEQRLLYNDKEAKEFVGSGQTPWDRFLNLMTPSFCTCSPAITTTQKTIH